MKKVILSLVFVAALTVVSCKEKEAEAPVEEAPVEEVAAPATEEVAAPAADTTATEVAAPATEEVKK